MSIFPFTAFGSNVRNLSENGAKKCPKIWGPKIKSPKFFEVNAHAYFNQQRTVINTRNKTNKILSQIEMIIENVEEEIPVVIMKIFEIQSCVRGFHFFQDSWQPKLGEFLNASNEWHGYDDR